MKRFERLLFLIALLPGAIASGQCPTPAWGPVASFAGSVTNQPGIYDIIEWDPDGPGPSPPVLVVGGSFASIDGVVASNIALFDGVSWQPLGPGPGGEVRKLAVYNGQLVASGAFFNPPGGGSLTFIERWNGSAWQPLGAGLDGWPSAMTVYNGNLIAAGTFLHSGSVTLNGIGRWDGTAWNPLGAGVAFGYPFALSVVSGELVAAGTFSFAGGVLAPHLARWNGSAWFPAPSGPDAFVRAILCWHDSLVVCGDMTSAGGVPVSHIARLVAGVWQPLGSGLTDPGYTVPTPTTLAEYDGDLVVGGSFTTVGGVVCHNVARWNGSCWSPLGAGLTGTAQSMSALYVHSGTLLAGGYFANSGPVPIQDLAQWNDPRPVLALAQPGGAGGGVVVSDSNLIAGHEYYNISSFEICSGCPGSGPYGGLCFSDPGFFYYELSFGVGFYPFHFLAPGPSVSSGPYVAPIGASIDAVCADVTGNSLGCLSRVVRFTAH